LHAHRVENFVPQRAAASTNSTAALTGVMRSDGSAAGRYPRITRVDPWTTPGWATSACRQEVIATA
jgi:hypothetical protein